MSSSIGASSSPPSSNGFDHWFIEPEKSLQQETFVSELGKVRTVFKGFFDLQHFPERPKIDRVQFTLGDKYLKVEEVKKSIGKRTNIDPSKIKISFHTVVFEDSDTLPDKSNSNGRGYEVFKVWYEA